MSLVEVREFEFNIPYIDQSFNVGFLWKTLVMTLDEEALFSQGNSQREFTDGEISQRDSQRGEFEHHITISTMEANQKQYCILGGNANISATLKT